ncbi:hypothetical protein [Tenacibaculum singaporense]|uniref:hypothetical protein n=1 Tax=Tenacibaculum singaporense TaxID=2358479 RepID=UPI000F671D71|nr:hypothetical protein [Tenacibaculum singaporense]RSC93669.1 hypothetical protein EI424_06600 [Tenacibaculum singaporense]
MFSKRIIILQLIIIGFNTINVIGQSDKYALLFKSTLEEESTYYDSEFSCEIKYSWRTFSFQYKSTSLNKREPQYDFYYLPDDFIEINLLFEGKVDYRTHTVPDCFMIPEISIDKTNFNIMPLFGCNFTVIVYPLHVEGTDNTEPVCSTTTLELRGGYDWEYLIGDTVSEDGKELEWKPLSFSTPSINPNIGDIYTIENINIDDLDVASPKRKIHFRAGHVASGTYVTPITYTVTGCSPQFIGYYDKIKTSCSYFKDGNISLKIDRDIDPSEQLVVTLFKDESSGDILTGQYSTKQLSAIDSKIIVLEGFGGGVFGFKWPVDIDAGIYYFRYQTLNEADTPQKPDASDSVFWDKLVKTPNFTIEKATNVDFTAKWVNDESCFEAGDGKIQIEVTSGETGRSYFYIVYKVEGTTETLERDWTSFSGTTTVISGLGKGEYKIKVKDNEGCLAK